MKNFTARKNYNGDDIILKSHTLAGAKKEAEFLSLNFIENSDTQETWKNIGSWKNIDSKNIVFWKKIDFSK